MMDLRINIKGSGGTGAVCRAADSERIWSWGAVACPARAPAWSDRLLRKRAWWPDFRVQASAFFEECLIADHVLGQQTIPRRGDWLRMRNYPICHSERWSRIFAQGVKWNFCLT